MLPPDFRTLMIDERPGLDLRHFDPCSMQAIRHVPPASKPSRNILSAAARSFDNHVRDSLWMRDMREVACCDFHNLGT